MNKILKEKNPKSGGAIEVIFLFKSKLRGFFSFIIIKKNIFYPPDNFKGKQ